MSKQGSFERKLNNPFFKYSKRFFDLVILNLIFCLVSVSSIFVLFVPGLVSLHTIANNMIHDVDENPYKTFFVEIKKQWIFNWRIALLSMSLLLVLGGIIAGDIIYKEKVAYDWIVWFSLVFTSAIAIVLITLFVNLMIFNSYFKNDTFWMMIRKTALITRKKIFRSLLNIFILASFAIVLYLVPYIIPFLSFSFYIYIVEAINRKMFTEFLVDEEKRETMDENLFLPQTVEDEPKK